MNKIALIAISFFIIGAFVGSLVTYQVAATTSNDVIFQLKSTHDHSD